MRFLFQVDDAEYYIFDKSDMKSAVCDYVLCNSSEIINDEDNEDTMKVMEHIKILLNTDIATGIKFINKHYLGSYENITHIYEIGKELY